MSRVSHIEVVEERTAESRCDEGFLRVRRLRLRNRYEDGTVSRSYACDIVSRQQVDAVAVVLHDTDEAGRPRVALRVGVRAPVALRESRGLPGPDCHPLRLAEIVAGVLEAEDSGERGIEARAAKECLEEAGYAVDPSTVRPLGSGLFASPGVTDEWVLFRMVETDLDASQEATGDGSVMEEGGELLLLPLREAIRRCRSGEIPDMKTEVALLRLCDAIGYVPALDCFVHELPAEMQARVAGLVALI